MNLIKALTILYKPKLQTIQVENQHLETIVAKVDHLENGKYLIY